MELHRRRPEIATTRFCVERIACTDRLPLGPHPNVGTMRLGHEDRGGCQRSKWRVCSSLLRLKLGKLRCVKPRGQPCVLGSHFSGPNLAIEIAVDEALHTLGDFQNKLAHPTLVPLCAHFGFLRSSRCSQRLLESWAKKASAGPLRVPRMHDPSKRSGHPRSIEGRSEQPWKAQRWIEVDRARF